MFILLTGIIQMMPVSAQMPSRGASAASTSVDTVDGERVVHTAMKYLGVRYRIGANGPKYFDCSGFTRFVFGQKNVPLTRCSRTQFNEGVPVEKVADLKPGDLVFFSGTRISQTVGHVGIVKELNADSSDVSFVHASRTDRKSVV